MNTIKPLLLSARRSLAIGSASIEAQIRGRPHLSRDRRHAARQTRRQFKDARRTKAATDAIGTIPGEGEALHLVVRGRFALWNVVPAALKLAGEPITELRIATLGFSRKNIEALCGMLDAGEIGKAWLLCSHYFKSTSSEIYEVAAKELAKRPAAHFLSIRTHAKLLLIRFASGRTLTVESSANLRSSGNIEQMTLFGDRGLHDFHAEWVEALFAAGGSR